MKPLVLVAALALGASAETFEDQIVLTARQAVDAILQAKADKLASQTAAIHAKAVALSVEYSKDPLTKRLTLRRGLSWVRYDFEKLADPKHSTIGFGFQTGPHIGLDGSIGLFWGLGFGSEEKAGDLTYAAKHGADFAKNPRYTYDAVKALEKLEDARKRLAPQLDALKVYAPKSAAESAWKDRALPAWTELLALIDEGIAHAAQFKRRR